MEEHNNDYGRNIHRLSKKIRYLADENLTKQNITLEQVKVIRYLSDNREKDIYQKDIEKFFEIKRSTVSSNLLILEKKGLIKRVENKFDARMKKVMLTENGFKLSDELRNFIKHLEEIIVDGFSEEEKEKFLYLLIKAFQNVSEYSKDFNLSGKKDEHD